MIRPTAAMKYGYEWGDEMPSAILQTHDLPPWINWAGARRGGRWRDAKDCGCRKIADPKLM
jgi:hypothetical protein